MSGRVSAERLPNEKLGSMMRLSVYLISCLLTLSGPVIAIEPAHSISYSQVQATIEAAMVEAGAGDAVEATISNVAWSEYHQSAQPIALKVGFIDFDDRTKRWEAELQLLEGGNLAKTDSLSGRYAAMIEVPVLARRIYSGDIITQGDIEMRAVPDQRLRHNVVQDPSLLVGQSARRALRAGQPISSHEIEAPIIVQRGDLLRLSYRGPYLQIQTVAEATEKAAAGQIIAVRNTDSGQLIRATVTAPGVAEIRRHLLLSQSMVR